MEHAQVQQDGAAAGASQDVSQDSVIHYVKGKGDDGNYEWTSAHCSTRHLREREGEREVT